MNGDAHAQALELWPHDEHNRALLENAHPPRWVNQPRPGRYNLLVIGAGTAGLVSAAGAAAFGGRVALIERHLLGGDCLNVGCVPSKALLRAARAVAAVRGAGEFGVAVPAGMSVRFGAVMERMRRVRARISPNDSAARFRGLGVDVLFGSARFTGPDRVVVGGHELVFHRAVVATGARAAAPAISGLEEAGYLTNETVFSLTELPRRLAVIGAGPIGCELAQAFARFGSQVFLFETLHGVLPSEDRAAAALVGHALDRDGVRLLCCARNLQVSRSSGGKRLVVDSHDNRHDVEVDEILVAVGRAPNVEGLELEAAGIRYDAKGVEVDDRLRTSNRSVYAAGDICSRYKFTHAAHAMAAIVVQNALFLGRAKASALTIPWCTYTDPEVAHVGLYEHEARERNIAIDTFTQSLDEVDRAVLDGDSEGFVRVDIRRGSDRIVGATIVAPHAGEMISEITLAMVGNLGLRTIARTIHPYPTQAEAIRRVADAYNRTRLTPWVRSIADKWLTWSRGGSP